MDEPARPDVILDVVFEDGLFEFAHEDFDLE